METLLELTQDLIQALRSKKYSVGFAESCTGGLLSATFTRTPGISDIFRGSIISYASDVKINVLGVPSELLQREGQVSSAVALKMAQQARKILNLDCSVGVTGIAGPTGGTPEKPIGTVHFGASGPGFDVTEKKVFLGNRLEIQQQSVQYAIEFLLMILMK